TGYSHGSTKRRGPACRSAECAGSKAVASARSARSLAVHALAQRDRRKLLVSRLFLLHVGIQKADDIVMAEALGPRDQRAVPSDFVVLDRLGGANDCGVEHLF